MKKLKQRIAFWIFKGLQKMGPHSVEVLGKTYRTDKHTFNPKLYLTSEFMAQNINVDEGATVLDMGSGSGIQAVTAAGKASLVVAVDINYAAARKTKENALANSVGERIFTIQGDLFEALSPRAKFDVIIFTPPYMEGTPGCGIERAWFDPGKSLVKRFFEEASRYLKSGGYVQMIYSSMADPDRVLQLAERLGWKHTIVASKRSILETFLIYRLTPEHEIEEQ